MKKSLSIIAIAVAAVFVACGPSKAEQEAKEKARMDSLRNDSAMKETARQDSINKMMEMEKMKQDSIAAVAKADSLRMAEEAGKKGKK